MAFVQNFPFFCIILSMFSAIISFVMNGRVAKYIHVAMVTAVLSFHWQRFPLWLEPVKATPYDGSFSSTMGQ